MRERNHFSKIPDQTLNLKPQHALTRCGLRRRRVAQWAALPGGGVGVVILEVLKESIDVSTNAPENLDP